jgi:NAD-dependent dihydropyrimidine dehydrogenase PreA subunit
VIGGELPQLDESRCIRCGDCVAACPADCLEARGGRPWLARPADCISCGACAAVCPTAAIALTGEPAAGGRVSG